MKTNPARVSVILTSFNHEKYLAAAIESVLNQTFSDFELIIWDDCSTDSSWQIIKSYDDPRIKAVRNNKNERGTVRKAVLSGVVRSELAAIHHSDDIWEPEKLAKQVAYLDEHPDIGAVFTHVRLIDEEGKPFTDENHFYYKIFDQPNRSRHEWLRFFFINGNALCHPSVLIRRHCYDECGLYSYGLAQLADFDMWLRLCLKFDIYIIQEKLIRFRVRENDANASGNRPEVKHRVFFEFYQLLSTYRKIGSFDELCQIFPEAFSFDRGVNSNIEFALAMVALELKPYPFTILFALDILFELISDPELSDLLCKTYQFDYKHFILLTGEYDPWMIQNLEYLKGVVSDQDNQINHIQLALEERTARAKKLDVEVHALRHDLEDVTSLKDSIITFQLALEERTAWAKKLDVEVHALRHNLEDVTRLKDSIITSYSWRLTQPLRGISRLVKGVETDLRQWLSKGP